MTAGRAKESAGDRREPKEAHGGRIRNRGEGRDKRLLKMHRQMSDMMKKTRPARRAGKSSGAPPPSAAEVAWPQPDPAMLEQLREERPRRPFGRGLPGGMGGAARRACRGCRRGCRGTGRRPFLGRSRIWQEEMSRLGFPASFHPSVKRTERETNMAVKIRLARAGAKKRPFYRIVVAERALRRATAASSRRSAPTTRSSRATARNASRSTWSA